MMKNETNETIADIVAEKRSRADEIERAAGREANQFQRELIADLRREADRIETAWERERQPLTIAEWIDKTETVADIAAVLRRYVLPSLAERLEAAWKRERAFNAMTEAANERLREHLQIALEGNKKPVGNAAAMREALCDIVMLTMKVGYSIHGDVACGIIASKAKHALSAPARNCDRFKTREEARNYFDNFVCLRSNGSGAIECKGCPLDSIDNPHRADCREAWLLAPAAERKGGRDGSK